VIDTFQLRKTQIKDKILCAKSKINLSPDGWHFPTCNEYMAICAHFINEEYKLEHCLLGFWKVNSAKSGQLIAEITANVINDYEIGQNLGAFMMDNATDNNTMLKELATQFDINVGYLHLQCLGHIINLVIKALLFGKGISKLKRKLAGALYNKAFKIWNGIGPIGKLHNICVYINHNSTKMTTFKECQEEDFQYYQLLTDGGVQWNSTEAMISHGMSCFFYLCDGTGAHYLPHCHYITAICRILPLCHILLLYCILPFSVTTRGIVLRVISRLFAAVISHYKLPAGNLCRIFL